MENWLALFDLEDSYASLSEDGITLQVVYSKWKGDIQQQGVIKICRSHILYTEFRQTPAKGNVIIRTQGTDGKKRNYNFVFKSLGFSRPTQDPATLLHDELFRLVGC